MSLYKRCSILKGSALLFTLATFNVNAADDPAPGKKYNVLFIVSDDLNNDMHCYGNAFVKTPNLDRLAARAVRFDRAYNQYPLCGPSRASFLTGLRPDVTKVADLESFFRDNLPNVITLPQMFKNNGYYSGRVGKIFHMGVPNDIGTNGQDDSLSWNERLNPKGRDKTDEAGIINLTPNRPLGSSLSYLIADGADEEQTDGLVATGAIDVMTKHKNDPFFLAVGFFRPHCPYIAPKKYFDMYPTNQVPLPQESADDWKNKPEAAQFTMPLNWGLDKDKQREALRAYYASITFMDAQVGRLLNALDQLKLADNTIIVFLSDHGYNVSQHGQWMKQSLFEHAARTPLIIAVPGITKGIPSERTVELLDVYPTLAKLCGLKAPDNIQGKDLLPLLKQPTGTWAKPAFTQVQRMPNRFQPGIKKSLGRSIRTEKWRYTEWGEGNDGVELYNYQADPNEFNNLAAEPKYASVVKELSAMLHASYEKRSSPQLGKAPVQEVIKAMTIEEKVSLVVGTGMKFPGLPADMQGPVVGQTEDRVAGAAGTTVAIPRLGIPSIVLADGPAGLRIAPFRGKDSGVSYYCTAFPIATLLASSWDTALVKNVGRAMGNEVKEYGVDVLLAPALNNQRNPLGGRNFEYYSEDPIVNGRITAAMVNGVQSEGVGTSVKHFIANNHEWNRNTINVNAGERALREIYLRGFELAIKEARPWTVMSSYNKVNGIYTSERKDLLTTVLRDEWGFKGFVMTDWFGGKDAVAQMKAGNDLLMPGTGNQYKVLLEAVKNKTLDEAVLDKNIEKILTIIQQTPGFKKYKFTNKPNLKAHAQVSRMAAAEGMVLLKNEGALPVTAPRKIAVFGNASYDIVTGGTGSGDVNEAYTISLTEGLQNAGFAYDKMLMTNYNAFIKEQKAKRQPMQNPFLLPPPIAEYPVEAGVITKLALENDVAVITIGRNSGEFADRKLANDYYLSEVEKDLIKSVADAFHAKGKKLIVLLNIGGVVEMMSWRDIPDAILLTWQPGQEAGNAIVDVLSGNINPSGKLATTFPVDYKDVPSAKNFPGKTLEGPDPNNHSPLAGDKAAEVTYEEGIYTGYRYYNKFNVKPAYEFGYGLSYTSFNYSELKLSSPAFNNKLTVTVTIANNGRVAGKEVVQLYISAPSTRLDKPAEELKAFAKTRLLQPGQSQTITFVINESDLASFDTNTSSWVADAGKYTVKVGSSSLNIKQTAAFNLEKNIVIETDHKVLSLVGAQ